MTQSITMLCHYAEYNYAECRILHTIMLSFTFTYYYAECRYAECHNAECRYAGVIMLNVVMLSVIMLNVIMLNIVAPHTQGGTKNFKTSTLLKKGSSNISISVFKTAPSTPCKR